MITLRPQFDGECANARYTDSWWEEHRINYLKFYQKYMDVLKDINETPLSENEKFIEQEKVTSARKEAFGTHCCSFPPWSCI